jgi:cytochrome c-type biogenesis protein CcmE
MLYFQSPSDLAMQPIPPGRQFRLGGLVKPGTVERQEGGLATQFIVTDGPKEVLVEYVGILPDLFREGQGVIARGSLDDSGMFAASEVLAKHDEKYMPPEVAEALKETGHTLPSNEDS